MSLIRRAHPSGEAGAPFVSENLCSGTSELGVAEVALFLEINGLTLSSFGGKIAHYISVTESNHAQKAAIPFFVPPEADGTRTR